MSIILCLSPFRSRIYRLLLGVATAVPRSRNEQSSTQNGHVKESRDVLLSYDKGNWGLIVWILRM